MSEREAEELRAKVIGLCPAGVAATVEWRIERALYIVALSALDRDAQPWQVYITIEAEGAPKVVDRGTAMRLRPGLEDHDVARMVHEALTKLGERVGGELKAVGVANPERDVEWMINRILRVVDVYVPEGERYRVANRVAAIVKGEPDGG